MQMPVMDALKVTRAIRTHIGPATPIIARTANAFGEHRFAPPVWRPAWTTTCPNRCDPNSPARC
jgi:hypothetical protein